MDLSCTPVATTVRHDGWTPARRARFLDRLAQDGNVLAACACVGLSREAAYRLRRRDPLFARAWAAALALAREATADVFGTRALDGIEEEVWYRGEVVGTRRRYDNRLLLAHMARLDKLAEANPRAAADAGRFDELLGCIAGLPVPAELTRDDADLPATRDEHIAAACEAADRAECAAFAEGGRTGCNAGEDELADRDDPEWPAREAQAGARWDAAYTGAAAAWDAWFDTACAAVDRLLAPPPGSPEPAPDCDARTLSPLSTSPSSAPR